jgi:hypothetical protein
VTGIVKGKIILDLEYQNMHAVNIMGALEFELTPTQEEYAFSTSVVNAIISNTGEGKTFASIASLPIHAKRCGKPIRGAIVRDTHQNIKMSTVPSIKEDFGSHVRFYDDYKFMRMFTNPPVEMFLLGIDDEAALSKLQGPEYAVIWLEEPAPMKDKLNAGLAEDVFNAALVRCTRQKGTVPRLQISMNPADRHHWTYRRLITDSCIDPDNPLITRRVWFIPYGENLYATEISRQAVKAAYRNDPAAYLRYVKGEFAPVYTGSRVTPQFSQELHVSDFFLKPADGLVSFRAWDGWHNPACLLGQITPAGRCVFIDALKLDRGGDVRQLIQTKVLPMMESPRWKGKAKAWRDIGDFSMMNPDQSNITQSPGKVIETAFKTVFEKGPSTWESMKLGLGRAFNTNINGLPALAIDPRLTLLIAGLEGGWHYKTDLSGNIVFQAGKRNPLPVKNEVSHSCDAFANAVNIIFPEIIFDVFGNSLAEANKRNLRRAGSYGPRRR